MSGRQSVPDTIKLARGTLRKSRVNKRQPKNHGAPKNPFDIAQDPVAFRKWREVVSGLRRLGLIDQIDSTHVENLSRNWQRAIQADQLLSEQGLLITLDDGRVCKNPAATVAASCWGLVRQLSNDLGLNHLSRQRMRTSNADTPVARMRRTRENTITKKYLD